MQEPHNQTPSQLFLKGDKIEVRDRNGAVSWRTATFLRCLPSQIHVLVQYDGGDRTDCFGAADVRPVPPPELHRYYGVGEKVEGFCRIRNGWRDCKVVDILENSRYRLWFFEGQNGQFDEGEGQNGHFAVVEQWELRGVREWRGDKWVPPFRPRESFQNKSSEAEGKSRGLKLKIKFSSKTTEPNSNEGTLVVVKNHEKKAPEPNFNEGTLVVVKNHEKKVTEPNFNEGALVEVKSDEKGFRGSWFTAVIVEPLENEKFLVEYRTLKTEDKTELLKEETDKSCIRPCPPFILQVKPFEYLEQVDAWYNDGWWEGYIVKVVNNGCKYTVHFPYSEEEMMFEHSKLRPRQEMIDGKWSLVSKVNLTDVNLKPNKVILKRKYSRRKASETIFFRDGMFVEVKSDEEGYQGSWYTAEIVSSLSRDKFLVEYKTLKNEDESGLLRELAFASYIRPRPPVIVRANHFEMFEEVDAWFNDGWWVGRVSKVLDGMKYAVYFSTTNEELVFEHSSLRPHHEWINGKWIPALQKKPKLTVKNKLGECKGQNDLTGVVLPNFPNKMKIEVKSDEPGYTGSWYPASIVKSLGSRKYLVEYQTLKTEDGTQLHKEEADALCIRPCPPLVLKKDRFRPFEEVDVWYNDGWWVGEISKALEGGIYSVYFGSTNEIMEFQHSQLRPHQDWINGQWVFVKKGLKPCSIKKLKK